MPSSGEPPLQRVELYDSEKIVDRGTQRTDWYVRVGDGWQRAARIPGATTTTLDVGPGTVWQICIELQLPAGTKLMRVQSSPRRERARDAFTHLLQGSRGPAVQTRPSYFRVGRRGEIDEDAS